MLSKFVCRLKKCKALLLPGVFGSLLLSGCESVVHTPALDNKGRPYSSDNLVKDWRTQNRARQQMVYPEDNDAEYYLPKYKKGQEPYKATPKAPAIIVVPAHPAKPVVVKPAPAVEPQYPEDADENYNTGYPKYDPEEDNSGYYYQNMNKPLPKPVDDGSGNTNYPIYFD